MFSGLRSCLAIISPVVCLLFVAADGPNQLAEDKQALAALQVLVGEWRGVGQPKRGSSQGAWTEECQWAWQFDGPRASLIARLNGDKFYSQLQLQAGDSKGQFVLLGTPAERKGTDGKPEVQRFAGQLADDVLTLTAEETGEEQPARITIRQVAGGDRLVVLYEKRAGKDAYARLAEVGSTRKGSSFAKAALGGPECVVTGGLGTIAVEHEGQKYFVCCGGCRDLFLDDPTGVLADYRERKAAEKAQAK